MRITKRLTAAAVIAAAIAAPALFATTASAAPTGVHAQVTVAADSGSGQNGNPDGTPWD